MVSLKRVPSKVSSLLLSCFRLGESMLNDEATDLLTHLCRRAKTDSITLKGVADSLDDFDDVNAMM